jgi:CBS domain-containing protein
MKKVKEIIESRGGEVARVAKSDSVFKAAQLMNDKRIGSVVVCEDNKVVGIFTERDILRRVVAERKDVDATNVGDVMTHPCAVCSPDDDIDHCQAVFTEKRIRHLPVVEDGKLVGIVTSGDVVASYHKQAKKEVEYLQEYIYGQ